MDLIIRLHSQVEPKRINRHKAFLIVLLLVPIFAIGQKGDTIAVATWNIQNFGKSKSDLEIAFMASQLKQFDAVAVQEVVAGIGGAPAVARLADALNRTGSKWDYSTSDPTISTKGGTERYAFLWKTSRLQRYGHPALEPTYRLEIEREPYMITFSRGNHRFTLVTLHAVPTSKQPERELKYLKYLPGIYPDQTLVILGDFNCPEHHSVFQPLKSSGYRPAITNQKTTLKRNCYSRNCLASAYDNIFYPTSRLVAARSGVVYFQESMPDQLLPEMISDHLPVFLSFCFK